MEALFAISLVYSAAASLSSIAACIVRRCFGRFQLISMDAVQVFSPGLAYWLLERIFRGFGKTLANVIVEPIVLGICAGAVLFLRLMLTVKWRLDQGLSARAGLFTMLILVFFVFFLTPTIPE